MRLALACLMTLPAAGFAETFTLRSDPRAVTVYADAGKVTREITAQLPAGRHEVILPGLPRTLQPELLRVSLDGATLGSTQFRGDAVAPQPAADSARIEAAKDRIKAAENALQDLDDRVAEAELAGQAAQATAKFLGALGDNEGLPTDVASLRALAQMIGSETLAAERVALGAAQEARTINAQREDLEQALKDARAALAALTPPPEKTAQLTLGLTAKEAGEVTISLTYVVGASWSPVYDVYLSGDTLDLQRGAMVQQWSGEVWTDVDLSLSTFALDTRTAPREVFPIPLRITDKTEPVPKVFSRAVGADMATAEPLIEAPVIAEEAARASFDGPGVAYVVANPVSVASDVDAVRVALGTLNFTARRFARAAPRYDSTAFLMAEFTNTTQEPLLASREAALYLDNTLIGRSGFEPVPAGARTDLPFGAIEDLRLTYRVLRESEGDQGIINRSNAKSETVRMNIENIGTRDWDVEVQAAVPYAVQDDLEISWSAEPAPDARNIKDRRGVLQWNASVQAGATASIRLRTDLKWPEGKILR